MKNDECKMQNEESGAGAMIDRAPDWGTEPKDLLCPLCGYNLRGLSEPRCPECGFQFTWRELIDAEKNRHPYLFEYGKGRNFATFWKTFWRTCRPRRFWREVNPAQEVRFFRLLTYWVLCSVVLFGVLLMPVFDLAYKSLSIRWAFTPVPGNPNLLQNLAIGRTHTTVITRTQLNLIVPLPWTTGFWEMAVRMTNGGRLLGHHSDQVNADCTIIYLMWPWLTLVSLLVFRFSMRRARIRTIQLLRSVIYSCDFSMMMLAIVGVLTLTQSFQNRFHSGPMLLCTSALVSLVTSYRLTIAFKKYLRVHLPLATVVSSQVMAFLICFILLVQLSNFSRQMW